MNPIINRKQDILYKDLAVDLTYPAPGMNCC